MRMWTRTVMAGMVAISAGGASGCAEERAPINRVQPNALAKSFFVGKDLKDNADDPQFYARGTVVDVGYGAAQDSLFTSSYADPVTIIRWQITEDLLIGRIAYERIEGSDGKGVGALKDEGQVAYAYPITSHFDVRRDYNPSTGEESNVIVENQSDRAWNDREYFRVDWSRNLNTDAYDYDTLSLLGIYGGISYEPIAYYVNDPKDADAPHFNFETGYFDVTNKAFASPGMIDLSHLGWGINEYPACYLPNDLFGGSWPAGNCNPVEVTIRQSFRRVEKSDYEPADWDGVKFQAFGLFYHERFGYARRFGITDSQWHRMADRYNIWQESHAYQKAGKGGSCGAGWTESTDFAGKCEVACYTDQTPVGADPNRDDDKDGTADECATVGGGSQCDTFNQKCTLPYAQRVTKPVVYFTSHRSNPDYYLGSEWAIQDWDVAIRSAALTARYTECVRIGPCASGKCTRADADARAAECEAQFPVYRGQQDENADAVHLATEVDSCRLAEGADDSPACMAKADALAEQLGYSAGVLAVAKAPSLVVLCHSPIEAGDSELCLEEFKAKDPRENDEREVLPKGISAADCYNAWFKEESPDQKVVDACDNGYFARQGDIRFNTLNNLDAPQTPSSWGILANGVDPLTGEVISAGATVWTHVTDLWTQSVVDYMRYSAGELSPEEVTEAKWIDDWSKVEESSRAAGALGRQEKSQIDRRLLEAANGRTFADGTPKVTEVPELPADVKVKVRKVAKEIQQEYRSSPLESSITRQFTDARRKAGQDTATEAEIITPMMLQLNAPSMSELKGNADVIAGSLSMVQKESSIFRGLNPQQQRDLRQAKEMALAARGACILHDFPVANGLAAMTKVVERKFTDTHGNFGTPPRPQGDAVESAADRDARLKTWYDRSEAVRGYLGQKVHYAVIAHELGHAMGMRHNFVSSSYAWGYRPQYWQLRTKNGAVKTLCEDANADSENCVGPRYFDAVTPNEDQNMIWMFMHSSIMDYAGELSQDLIGLGAYDFAAARMFYGGSMAVHADASYDLGGERAPGMVGLADNFGGIVGYKYTKGKAETDIHYSQLNESYDLIKNCREIPDPYVYQPSNWDASVLGAWDPLLDGLLVQVDGKYSRCETQKVDYVPYEYMRRATEAEGGVTFRNSKNFDPAGRTRVPYGFATDSWADTGNLSVFRHDNGADAYELFNFFISEQEQYHIFADYRRGRTSFSVKSQANRILGRYNEKMRDAAKGLGLYANIYRAFSLENLFTGNTTRSIPFENLWAAVVNDAFLKDNMIASGIAFDHFTRQLQRPEAGEHYFDDLTGTQLSSRDTFATPGDTTIVVPTGATGRFGMIGMGGKLVENTLSEDKGEYDRDYQINAGSYYDKVNAPYLLTESVDNFISDSRQDFVDGRYRAVSMADLFPDGYRRLLANTLTGDAFVKGVRVAGTAAGQPEVDDVTGFPTQGFGWTSWWASSPEACFPNDGRIICSTYGCEPGTTCEYDQSSLAPLDTHPLNPKAPAQTAIVDAELSWEIQKFMIVQTLLYLPENQKRNWIDMMGIWEEGSDSDPSFENRLETHLPDGRVYIAKTYGTEDIFGKVVQRGVAARVLEWANILIARAYVTAPDPVGGWPVPVLDANGNAQVLHDPTVISLPPDPTCSPTDNSGCTCEHNRHCVALKNFESVPAFMRQAMHDLRMADPTMRGIYE